MITAASDRGCCFFMQIQVPLKITYLEVNKSFLTETKRNVTSI